VLFFLVLVFLALQAHAGRDVLPWMALVFGLSLSNHWPLMGLVAPGFLIALWPRLREMARRLPLLAALFLVGLLPYAWMVWRSWQEPPISYLGPLESWREVWFVLSRASYQDIDQRPSASWLDRVGYVRFLGYQLIVQLALAGAALALAGFVQQWRAWGRRIGAFLVVAFLGPTLGLVLLLNFDYDSFHQHVFHVYPLPSYAVAALWLALGFAWCADRWVPRRAPAAAAALLALMLAWGAYGNLRSDFGWAERYARTVLTTLPPGAAVYVQGDGDLPSIGYLHMIENVRPDITLFQAQGLVLGSRLFHPLRVKPEAREAQVRRMIDAYPGPVVFVLDRYMDYAQRDRWLYLEVDRSSRDGRQSKVDVPEEALRFFEESVAATGETNGWTAYFQAELRKRYATLLGRSLPPGQPADARTLRHLALLEKDFYGALGLAEGLLARPEGVPPTGALAGLLERARVQMPADTPKLHVSRYFYVRGLLRLAERERAGALAAFDTSLSIWPVAQNPSAALLESLYRDAGDARAADAVRARVRGNRL
jgi:hypothetical protein